MRFALPILAALPATLASMLAYTPPPELATMAEENADCVLPGTFLISHFAALRNETDGSLSTYNFGFYNNETQVQTSCEFNNTSPPINPPGSTPRFACDDDNIRFLWENDDSELWMIQRVCPGSDGAPVYEASGSIALHLACAPGTNECSNNATTQSSRFTSVQPVRDSA